MNTTKEKPAELLTVDEVAGLLKFHPVYIRRLFAHGRLGGVKLGRALRFRPQDVERFVNDGAVEVSVKGGAA